MTVQTTNNQQPAKRRACPEPRRRGAPAGNLNALKSGAHSKQLKLLVQKLLGDPQAMRLIAALSGANAFRAGHTAEAVKQHALQARTRKERERKRLRRAYEWLPYYEEGAAPF